VQNVVGVRHRATATALLLLCLTLLALAGGPPFTGALIDRFAELHFAHPQGAGGTLESLRSLASGGGGTAFRQACLAAGRLASGSAGAGEACGAALARASRDGILVSLSLYVWAAAHYVAGAAGLGRQMQSAAETSAAEAAQVARGQRPARPQASSR
jgi:hypothetical protein